MSELVGKTLTKKERRAADKLAKERRATEARRQPVPAPVADGSPVADRTAVADKASKSKSKSKSKPSRVQSEPASSASEPPARRRRLVATVLLTVALLAGLGALGAIAWKVFRVPTHEVPALDGVSLDAGLTLVDDLGWEINTRTTRSDQYPTAGQIVRTAPAALTELAEGSPLTIFVSAGPELRTVPALAGRTVDEARAELTALGLTVAEPQPVYDEVAPAGQVLAVAVDGVAPGGTVLPGATATLEVSDGPAPRLVPNLVGATTDQATSVLEQVDLGIEVGDTVRSGDVPEGQIAVQEPAPGTGLAPGSVVVVQLSEGVELVAVPELSGLTLEQASAALDEAGLYLGAVVGTSGTVFAAGHDGAPVSTGDVVPRGSSVNVSIL